MLYMRVFKRNGTHYKRDYKGRGDDVKGTGYEAAWKLINLKDAEYVAIFDPEAKVEVARVVRDPRNKKDDFNSPFRNDYILIKRDGTREGFKCGVISAEPTGFRTITIGSHDPD
jgi:hypothetical protein